jgi:integrase
MTGTGLTTEPSRRDLLDLLDTHVATLGLGAGTRRQRHAGLCRLLDWLEGAPGASWQASWEATGAETVADWQAAAGVTTPWQRPGLVGALQLLLCHRLIRPSYPWLLRRPEAFSVKQQLRAATDRDDFDRLAGAAAAGGVTGRMLEIAVGLLARVLVHTGKRMDALTTAELLDYAEACRAAGLQAVDGLQTTHQLLRALGIITDPPITSGYTQRAGRYTVEEMVDRHRLACRPVRDLLVRYLHERAAALDYASLRQVEMRLVGNFWRDLERHHPGIASIHLPDEVACAWRERTWTLADGRPRGDVHSVFLIVRSFYLDVAHWAAENPAAWGAWVAPSPVSEADLRQFAKVKHRHRARMHARTRSLAPLLPKLVAAAHQRLDVATQVLAAAEGCAEGATFTAAGCRYRRLPIPAREAAAGGTAALRVQALDAPMRPARNCRADEDEAFWAWAVIEVLRLTGIRLEELQELTHLSIRHYRMPDEQLVVLLQIAPSKTDRERVLPVCPELAHALARIVARARGDLPHVPAVARYDYLEREYGAPLPYLFQRQRAGNRVLLSRNGIRGLLRRAVAHADLRDVDGEPLRFTAHDFRRVFATEAVNGGLPIHIAAKLLGHLDLNTTQAYVAIYPEAVVRQVQAHTARRRALRPAEEYREPTAAEWREFEQHFRRRKLALGDCYRPYGTDCPHEHACVRCPMLRMDPAQLPRLLSIEQDTHRLLAEARAKGWDGEVLGLETTLHHIAEKKAQAQRLQATSNSRQVVWVALEPEPKQPPTR